MNSRPLASIIMRCKNSDWVIEQALTALFAQDFTDFELIVVDSGSTDRTLDIVRNFPCRLLEIDPVSYVPGAVLNMAASKASGDLLVFQNSDTVPLHPSALSELLAPFNKHTENRRLAATFARQIPRPEAASWVRRDYAAAFPKTSEHPSWMTFSLPFAAIRKQIWMEHPFYDEAWASEDTQWGKWALDAGYDVQYIPQAEVMHSHNYTLNQIYGRRFVEGEADAFIYPCDASKARGAALLDLAAAIGRAAVAAARDCRYAMRNGDVPGALAAPIRRTVYQWAHWQGLRHGQRRRWAGDTSLQHGLKIILRNHDAVAPRKSNSKTRGQV